MKKKFLIIIMLLLIITGCKKDTTTIPSKAAIKLSNTKPESSVFEYGELISIKDIFKDLDLVDEDIYLKTSELGENFTKFKYIENNKEKTKGFRYTIVDTTKPFIMIPSTVEVDEGFSDSLDKKGICTDNYDKDPECYVSGYYNTDVPGSYQLKYTAIDSSGNEEDVEFTLVVKKEDIGTPPETTEDDYILFSDAYKEYKKENTMIGIDVSMWQGKIDWEKVKAAGVEFAIIRLGYQFYYKSEEMELDPYFTRNIERALENGIDVGVYFYSFATTPEEARTHANFVINSIKDYNVTMPIAYDWENFSMWDQMHINTTDLRNASYAFQDTLKAAGYRPVQYGSRNTLYSFWAPMKYETWLAHYLPLGYTSDYKGSYVMWQLTNTGRVDGISGNVDIDVYYK